MNMKEITNEQRYEVYQSRLEERVLMVTDANYYYLSIIFFLSAEDGVRLFPE
jgi:hypothetical protein